LFQHIWNSTQSKQMVVDCRNGAGVRHREPYQTVGCLKHH